MVEHFDAPVVLGAGPVGRAVAAALVSRGHGPLVVTRSGTDVPGASTAQADVSSPVEAKSVLADASIVFQCSQPPYHRWEAEFPAMQRSILTGCAASGAPLVAVENLYGHGEGSGVMTESTPLRPTTRKGKVRAELWDALHVAHRSGLVPTAAVRASDFFGPGVLASAFGERFFGPLVAGKKVSLMGPPEHRHAITYVRDLAEALVAVASDADSWGRAWIAPTAPARRMGEIVELAAAAAGVAPRSRVVAPWQLRLVGRFVPDAGEVVEMLYQFHDDFDVDSSAAEDRFGLSPTPLDTAIAETIAWYRERGGVRGRRS